MGEPRSRPESERERLNALLVRYGPAVRGFIGRRVRSGADADDLTQEVIARILRRADAGPIDNLEGYLFQAAANLLRERGRQTTVWATTPAIELAPELIAQDEVQTPERILLGRDAYKHVLAALLELPERTRTVFILNRFEDVKGPEIARRLGISISAVEKHMMKALAHLRARVR
jgi:RNA polymerase sigma factor (sigma-70 family)